MYFLILAKFEKVSFNPQLENEGIEEHLNHSFKDFSLKSIKCWDMKHLLYYIWEHYWFWIFALNHSCIRHSLESALPGLLWILVAFLIKFDHNSNQIAFSNLFVFQIHEDLIEVSQFIELLDDDYDFSNMKFFSTIWIKKASQRWKRNLTTKVNDLLP